VDREARRNDAAWRVDVHEDVFLGVFRLKKKQLCSDNCSHVILDTTGDEDDTLTQQARVNVEAALAAGRLLDHDGDEAADDVGVVGRAHAGIFPILLPLPISAVAPEGSTPRSRMSEISEPAHFAAPSNDRVEDEAAKAI
jgi:hypothetical protein